MDFHSLTRRELQTLCKKNGIPANITNVAMADSLKALQSNVQGIEDLANCSQSVTAQSGVDSPEKSELTSSRVPRTRSIRKKIENDTVVNQTMSRTRRTARNLNSGSAGDEKDTIPPMNIDVQFSEVQNKKISVSKEAGIPQTPSIVSNSRKQRAGKGETTAKTYGTRRSTRLAAKTQEGTTDAANMKLFSTDGGDEMSVNESCPDLSVDVQSAGSLSEVVSETSKCEEMTSSYSGVEIQQDLGSGFDSTMDCDKIIETVIAELPEEESKGDDVHKQPEVENNDVVMGQSGDGFDELSKVENSDEAIGDNGVEFYEESEVAMEDKVTAENGDGFTKQSDNETIAEVAAESEDLNGEDNELNDNGEVVTGEVMNCLTDNDAMLAESKDHDAENLDVDMHDLTFVHNGDMIADAEGQVAGDDTLVVVDKCDMIAETEVIVEEVVSEELDADLVNKSEEKTDVVAEEQLVVDQEFVPKSEEEMADIVAEEQPECDNPSHEILGEVDGVTIAAEKQLDNSDCDKVVEDEDEKTYNIVVEEQLVKPACDKPSQEILGEEQMIFVDEEDIVLPEKRLSAENPNVVVGKENEDISIRWLKKQLKQLSIDSNNKKGNSVKLDEEVLGTAQRTALQTLPENQQL